MQLCLKKSIPIHKINNRLYSIIPRNDNLSLSAMFLDYKNNKNAKALVRIDMSREITLSRMFILADQ